MNVLTIVLAMAALGAAQARAGVLANFESGGFAGWTLTGNAWTVGGCGGQIVTICPPEGSFFARSGLPNDSGATAETNTGSATSPAYVVTFDTLTWLGTGWSGPTYDGQSYLQILDAGFNVVAQFSTPQCDCWQTISTNLLTDGLSPNATFYFRSVDGRSSNGYSWMAIDALTLTGQQVGAPEPGTGLLLLASLGLICCCRRHCR
jgi:hypothetical protein